MVDKNRRYEIVEDHDISINFSVKGNRKSIDKILTKVGKLLCSLGVNNIYVKDDYSVDNFSPEEYNDDIDDEWKIKKNVISAIYKSRKWWYNKLIIERKVTYMEGSKVRGLDSESEKLRKRYVALKKQLEQLYKELEEQEDEDAE